MRSVLHVFFVITARFPHNNCIIVPSSVVAWIVRAETELRPRPGHIESMSRPRPGHIESESRPRLLVDKSESRPLVVESKKKT